MQYKALLEVPDGGGDDKMEVMTKWFRQIDLRHILGGLCCICAIGRTSRNDHYWNRVARRLNSSCICLATTSLPTEGQGAREKCTTTHEKHASMHVYAPF
jgi:hypothetical protein